MSDKKIVVPEGMFDAAMEAVQAIPMRGNVGSIDRVNGALKAALRWLSENPIVPTKEQWDELRRTCWVPDELQAVEWQRRMFLAPQPEQVVEVRVLASDLDKLVEAFENVKRAMGKLEVK